MFIINTYITASMFPDFAVPEAGKLSLYSAVFCFAGGVLRNNFLFNTLLTRHPFSGAPLTYADYFRGSGRSHFMGGAIWCVGIAFSNIASGKAGAAISYGLGQDATVMAAVWGIYISKEFKKTLRPVIC